MIIAKLVDDVQLRLTGGKPSDDISLTKGQIRHWIDVSNKTLLPAWIKDKNGGNVPTAILYPIKCLKPKEEDTCWEGCSNFYLELDRIPMTLPKDAGVHSVLLGNRAIHRLESPEELSIYKNIRFSGNVPYYYREANKLYLFNHVVTPYSQYNVNIAISDSEGLPEDAEYPSVDDVIGAILDNAEQIGKRQMKEIQDLINDGTE